MKPFGPSHTATPKDQRMHQEHNPRRRRRDLQMTMQQAPVSLFVRSAIAGSLLIDIAGPQLPCWPQVPWRINQLYISVTSREKQIF